MGSRRSASRLHSRLPDVGTHKKVTAHDEEDGLNFSTRIEGISSWPTTSSGKDNCGRDWLLADSVSGRYHCDVNMSLRAKFGFHHRYYFIDDARLCGRYQFWIDWSHINRNRGGEHRIDLCARHFFHSWVVAERFIFSAIASRQKALNVMWCRAATCWIWEWNTDGNRMALRTFRCSLRIISCVTFSMLLRWWDYLCMCLRRHSATGSFLRLKCAHLRHLMSQICSKDILVFLDHSLRSLSSLEVDFWCVFFAKCESFVCFYLAFSILCMRFAL